MELFLSVAHKCSWEPNPVHNCSPQVWILTHPITLIQVSDSCSCPQQGTDFFFFGSERTLPAYSHIFLSVKQCGGPSARSCVVQIFNLT